MRWQEIQWYTDRSEAWQQAEQAQFEQRFDRAVELWRKFLELEPGDAQAHANLAQCVSCTGDFKGGLREAREAVHRAPHLSGARGVLLEALENNELFEEFRGEAERQAKEYPEDFPPWEAQARVALMDNDASKAKRCLLKAVDIKPDSNFAWIHLGALYMAEGNCLEAFKAFGKAQASAEDSPFPLQVSRFSALIGMAYSQLYMDKAEWALILAEQAERLNVNVAEARRLQARCKLSLSSVDAVSTVESAIKLGGRDGYLEMALALHKVESGDKIGARNTIETVDPGPDPYARNLRASTLSRLGRLPDALEQLEDLAGELPEYVRQNSISIAYLYNNQPHEALSAIREALKHRRDEATLTNAGILCAGNGQLEEAEGFFKEALDVRPDSPSALLNLGRLYIEKGKYSLARTTLKKVANSDKYDPRLQSAAAEELAGMEKGEEIQSWMKREELGIVSMSEADAAQQLLDHYKSQQYERECCRRAEAPTGPLRWSKVETGKVIRSETREKEIDVYGVAGSAPEALYLGECKLRIRSSNPVSESEINELVEKLDLAARIEEVSEGREVNGFFFSNVLYSAEAKQVAAKHRIRLFVAMPTKNWQSSASWRVDKLEEIDK